MFHEQEHRCITQLSHLESSVIDQLLLIIFVGGICCLNIPNKMLCTQKMVIWSSFKQQQQQKTNNGM
jgi:hypothetical protein